MNKITEIAKAAGVSPACVSKAFNDYDDISEKTREKIFKIAKEYDYFPKRSASQLVSRNKDTIGVLLSMMGHRETKEEYLLSIISGIYNFAESIGFHVEMFTASAIINNNQNYIQFCYSNNLIGTIIHGLDTTDPQLSRLIESETPCVFIDNNIEGLKTSSVSVDNEKACTEVIDKLVGLGHKHICYVSGSELSSVSIDRRRGYEKGIKKHSGLNLEIIQSKFIEGYTYEKVKEYILNHPEVTAFFCASDSMAVGALNACQDLHYKVPEDISIIGFDDISFASYVRPQLSTVAQDFFGMGIKAAELLVEIFNGKEVPKHCYLDYEIKMRQSVAKNNRK